MTTTKTLPDWATVGATVYEQTQGGRSDATYRKGTVTRVTTTSIFVSVKVPSGEATREDRYALQPYDSAPTLWGSKDSFYRRTLISETKGLHYIAEKLARHERQQVINRAKASTESFAYSASRERAEEAIAALQAYLALDN